MTSRLLVIPAAGLGSRLGSSLPKLLVAVNGTPMIDRLRDLYASEISGIVLIVHPSFAPQVRSHVQSWSVPVTVVVQHAPTGMLDALLLATDAVRGEPAGHVWITWCDQVGVHPDTVRRLAATAAPDTTLVMPTVIRDSPYIHLARDAEQRIVRVLHRREEDDMPAQGESDMGLFALSRLAFTELLPRYAAAAERGRITGERNFLPFVAWLARSHPVVTFPAVDEAEAVGVNTPAELAQVERYLAQRDGRDGAEQ